MEDKQKNSFNPYMYTLEIGFRISIPLILFVIAGVWLDRKLGTSPWILLSGIALSLVTSVYGIKKTIDNMNKDN